MLWLHRLRGPAAGSVRSQDKRQQWIPEGECLQRPGLSYILNLAFCIYCQPQKLGTCYKLCFSFLKIGLKELVQRSTGHKTAGHLHATPHRCPYPSASDAVKDSK